MKSYQDFSILQSHHWWTISWILFFINSSLHALYEHLWPSLLFIHVNNRCFFLFFPENWHPPFSTPSSDSSVSVFVIWTLLSHCFIHFQRIIYTNFSQLCFNSRLWNWWHLFYFTFRPSSLNIFVLILRIWHFVFTSRYRTFCHLQPSPILCNSSPNLSLNPPPSRPIFYS